MTPRAPFLALALLLPSVAARAAGKSEPTRPRVSSAAVAAVERVGLAGCRRNPERLWSFVAKAFGQVFAAHLHEIEGAMPGRFIPGADVTARRRLDEDGHFTVILCRGAAGAAPCPERRGPFEGRVIEASLLRSLPGERSHEDLYDPESWEVTALGRETLDEAKRCWPDLKARTAALVLRSLGGR